MNEQQRRENENGEARTHGRMRFVLAAACLLVTTVAVALATQASIDEPAKEQLAGDEKAAARPTRRWGENYFPDVYLTTHEGKRVHFYRDLLQDKVVAINFMFTSCGNVCPAETARLKQVHELLGDRVGEDIHMYSITVDPEVDHPEVLADYRERFGIGEGWTFLRASPEDTDLIQRKLGLLVEKLDDPNDHNASLVLGNERTGRWTKRSPYDNPQQLAHLLAESMHNWAKGPRKGRKLASYAAAPSRANWETGERIFRTRCAACHSMGEGSGLGPDLAGVTESRDQDWLVRWIMEPDALIDEGDATAVALLHEWNDIRMPNLGLDEKEARAVIGFMASWQGGEKQARAVGLESAHAGHDVHPSEGHTRAHSGHEHAGHQHH